MPNCLLGVLPPAQLVVYLVLLYHRDSHGLCWPSLTTISEESTIPRSSVKVALNELEKFGLITRTRRRDVAGDWTSTEYLVTVPEVGQQLAYLGQSVADPLASSWPTGRPTVGHKQEPIEQDSTELNPDPISSTSTHDLNGPAQPATVKTNEPATIAAAFVAFKNAWPGECLYWSDNRVRSSLAAALQRAPAATIINGAIEYAATNPGHDGRPQYIKSPHKWLDENGWNDHPKPRPKETTMQYQSVDEALALPQRDLLDLADVDPVATNQNRDFIRALGSKKTAPAAPATDVAADTPASTVD